MCGSVVGSMCIRKMLRSRPALQMRDSTMPSLLKSQFSAIMDHLHKKEDLENMGLAFSFAQDIMGMTNSICIIYAENIVHFKMHQNFTKNGFRWDSHNVIILATRTFKSI